MPIEVQSKKIQQVKDWYDNGYITYEELIIILGLE